MTLHASNNSSDRFLAGFVQGLPSSRLASRHVHAGNLRGWWIWAYWINPLNYAMRAVVLNEFTAPRWQHPVTPGSTTTVGNAVLAANGFDHPHWCVPLTWYWSTCNAKLLAALQEVRSIAWVENILA